MSLILCPSDARKASRKSLQKLDFCARVLQHAFLRHCSSSDFAEIYPAVHIEIEPAIGINESVDQRREAAINVLSLFMGDEIDASMDANRAQKTSQLLHTLKDRISQLVLVSHKFPQVDYHIVVGGDALPSARAGTPRFALFENEV